MQLGYTIPLQRFLRMKPPPYGGPCDLRLCWDLHLISPTGRGSLFCVHTSSRFAFLLYGLSEVQWREVPAVFREELGRVLAAELGDVAASRYLETARECNVTRTHGRRPVAFLNRAVDDLYRLAVGLEEETLEQPQVRLFLNDMPCRAAGHEGMGTARRFLQADIE